MIIDEKTEMDDYRGGSNTANHEDDLEFIIYFSDEERSLSSRKFTIAGRHHRPAQKHSLEVCVKLMTKGTAARS